MDWPACSAKLAAGVWAHRRLVLGAMTQKNVVGKFVKHKAASYKSFVQMPNLLLSPTGISANGLYRGMPCEPRIDLSIWAPRVDAQLNFGLHCGCLNDPSVVDDLRVALDQAGFARVRIKPKGEIREFIKEWAPGLQFEDAVISAVIVVVKP